MRLQFIAVSIVAFAFVGCVPAQTPTSALRTAVVMTAEAVHQADALCATVGLEKKDVVLLQNCKTAYDIARPALVAAEFYLSIGDQKNLEGSLCTAEHALASTASAIAATGTKIPPIVTEAITLGDSLCK